MSKQVRGMLTREELGQLVESGEIDTVLVVFPDLYGRFVGKRFDAEFFMRMHLITGRTVATTCSRWIWDETRFRLRLRQLGARLRGFPPRPGFCDAAADKLAG